MADAVYFHTTLYAFGEEARRAVISRLNTAVKNVTIKCTYSETDHSFCLTCPQDQGGPEADGQLVGIISDYIKEETAQAEQEERPPNVTRFQESDFDEFEIPLDEPSLDGQIDSPASSGPTQTPAKPSLTVAHFVSGNLGDKTLLKLFRLRDMPDGVLERTLSKTDPAARKAVSLGFRIRAVRWSSATKDYTFNSRVGTPIHYSDTTATSVLHSANFTHLSDQRPVVVAEPMNDEDGNDKHWRFVPGTEPKTIQQFLAGMGQTELDDPDEMPEMPPDAQRFVARPGFGATATTGRARIPKARGASISSVSEKSDNSDDDSEPLTFNGMLAGKSSRTKIPLAIVSDSDSGTDDDGSNDQQLDFTALLQKRNQTATANPLPVQTSMQSTPPPPTTFAQALSTGVTATDPGNGYAPSVPPTEDTSHNTLPNYNRNYTRVDRVGLTSIPSHQAEWEIENQSPRKQRTNRLGVGMRSSKLVMPPSPEPTPSASIAMSMSTGPDVRVFRNTPREVEEWARQPAQVPLGRLVDDSAPQTGRATMPPPGLIAPKRVAASSSSRQQAQGLHEGLLIDDFAPQTSGRVVPPPGLPIRVQLPPPPNTPHLTDEIVERLEQTPQQARRYDTMRQKAKKKGRGNSHKKPEVQLPKPDPLPLLAPKPLKKPAVTGPAPSPAIEQPIGKPAENVTTAAPTSLGRFFLDIADSRCVDGLQAEVCFGAILVRVPKGGELTGAYDSRTAEQKLCQAELQTDFFPRLTTAMNDAEYMLASSTSTVVAEMKYDIHIKTTDGIQRVIRFTESERSNISVFDPNDAVGTVYLHYPYNVWDAQIVLVGRTEGDNLAETCASFVNSIHSFETPPTFQAQVPSDIFHVEKVLAKRIFSQRMTDTISLRVVEVQELQVVSVSSPNYNMRAMGTSKEAMIDEQRLWWEGGLTTNDVAPEGGNQLQGVIDEVVDRIDGVGYNNQGPWVRETIPEVKGAGTDVDWFW